MADEKRHRILIVEDEKNIRGFLKLSLRNNGFEVYEADSGEAGLKAAQLHHPHVVLLDIGLPFMDGFAVCKAIRKVSPAVGIIMLTAKSMVSDKAEGFSSGADDYCVKPVELSELIMRINALLRRMDVSAPAGPEDILESEPFLIDLSERKVYKNGRTVKLTPIEFMLLRYLITHTHKALSRNELLDAVWGSSYMSDSKVVDVHIKRLRTKIQDEDPREYIATVWGTGYRWQGGEGCCKA